MAATTEPNGTSTRIEAYSPRAKSFISKVFRLEVVAVTLLNDYLYQDLISVFSKILLGHKAEVELDLM